MIRINKFQDFRADLEALLGLGNAIRVVNTNEININSNALKLLQCVCRAVGGGNPAHNVKSRELGNIGSLLGLLESFIGGYGFSTEITVSERLETHKALQKMLATPDYFVRVIELLERKLEKVDAKDFRHGFVLNIGESQPTFYGWANSGGDFERVEFKDPADKESAKVMLAVLKDYFGDEENLKRMERLGGYAEFVSERESGSEQPRVTQRSPGGMSGGAGYGSGLSDMRRWGGM